MAMMLRSQICMIAIILALNWQSIKSNTEFPCLDLSGSETCYTKDGNSFRNYGTKTSYHISYPNATSEEFKIEGCQPHMFYIISRHATRYPDKDRIVKMIELLPVLKEKILNASLLNQSSLCQNDINKLNSWEMTMTPDMDNKLTDSGKAEAAELGQRYKNRFPTILGKDYDEEDFIFQYTSRERTRTTAEAFAEGLFGRENAKSINFDGKTNDDVLQFHKDCKKLMKNCDSSKQDLRELDKFEEGPMMQSVASSISQRLGFNISIEDVATLYSACAFGYALKNSDAWCSVFSEDELKVLEYEGDLDDYYKDGYGNEINYEQACPFVNYVVNLFNSSMHQMQQKAVLQFSHAGAVKKIYSSFGLFQDEDPMTADGLCSNEDRKWKSSLICPFNSNLALALFKCDSQYKIAAFHNEKQVILGGCPSFLCPIEDFMKKYTPVAENCSINELCCTCCIS